MKQLLFLFAMFAGMAFVAPPVAKAQAVPVTGQFYSTTQRATDGRVLDTASNTTVTSQFGAISGFQDYVGITVAVTKLTGTPGGKVFLWGTTKTGFTKEQVILDSLIVTNSSPQQTHTFRLRTNDFVNYETRYTPTGSQTSTIQTYWITRKR